jgi:sirohydrochlorin cobaltochelatase
MTTATVFFCHGARAQSWREPFDQLLERCRSQAPQRRFELAFLELMQPGLPEVVSGLAQQGISQVQVVPLFLAPGSHTQRDLPELIAQCLATDPQLTIVTAPVLLEMPGLADWLVPKLLEKAL